MSPKPSVLVVEDDTGVRDLVRATLSLAGYDVYAAHDGAEALSRLRGWRPDAMVLDINMPRMDGFGVLQALPGQLKGRRLPVLVLTARHDSADVRRAVQLGAKDYLTKPFDSRQLLGRMARLLRPAPEAVAVAPPPAPAAPASGPEPILI